MASVFRQAAACFETIVGAIQIPDHPLVREVMQDVLQEAMDLEGLIEVLRGIHNGSIRCLAVDTPVPSQFAHELLNANPYAFLDEAGLEERRARAVSLSRGLPDSVLEGAGRLDQHAIDTVRSECWPDLRDEHELHDLLQSAVVLPLFLIDTDDARHWPSFYERLTHAGRAKTIDCGGVPCWIATERLAYATSLWPSSASCHPEQNRYVTKPITKEGALKQLVQGWLQIFGPTTANAFAQRLAREPATG